MVLFSIKECMLVFYCHVTGYQKLYGLKQCQLIIPQLLQVRNLDIVYLGDCGRVPCLTRLQLRPAHPELTGFFQGHLGVGRIQFLQVPSLALVGHPSLDISQHDYFLQRQPETNSPALQGLSPSVKGFSANLVSLIQNNLLF